MKALLIYVRALLLQYNNAGNVEQSSGNGKGLVNISLGEACAVCLVQWSAKEKLVNQGHHVMDFNCNNDRYTRTGTHVKDYGFELTHYKVG